MNSITEAQAKSAYAERILLEKAGEMAIRHCQWELAKKHYESALGLLPVDPHRGEHFDAERYRREIRICSAMSNTSRGMRPTRDNPLFEAELREHSRQVERYRDSFWEDS